MLASHANTVTFNGQPALLRVMRNDGYCWGRIETSQGQFDVSLPDDADAYEEADCDALDRFEEAAKDATNVSPATGWL